MCTAQTFIEHVFGNVYRHIGNRTIKMQVWDTAGQERFRAMVSSFTTSKKEITTRCLGLAHFNGRLNPTVNYPAFPGTGRDKLHGRGHRWWTHGMHAQSSTHPNFLGKWNSERPPKFQITQPLRIHIFFFEGFCFNSFLKASLK